MLAGLLLLLLALLVPSQPASAGTTSSPRPAVAGAVQTTPEGAAPSVVAAHEGTPDHVALTTHASGVATAGRVSSGGGGAGLPLGWLVVAALVGTPLLLAQRARPPTPSYSSRSLTSAPSRAPPAVAGT